MANFDLNKLLSDLVLGAGRSFTSGASNVAKNVPPVPSASGFGGELLKGLLSSSPEEQQGQQEQPLTPVPKEEKIEPGPREKAVQSAINKRHNAAAEGDLNARPAPQVLEQAKTLDQQDKQKEEFSTLNKLLFGLGVGMASFGGKDTAPLFAMRGQQIAAQDRRNEAQAGLSLAKREEIELKGSIALANEQFKQAAKLSQEGRLKPGELFSKFEKASEPFIQVKDGFARIDAAFPADETGVRDFTNPNPVADLDLLFGTAKTLDPGGRVTDSDVAIQLAVTGRFGDKIKKIVRSMQKRGGVFLPEEREFMFNQAIRRFKASENQQRKTTQQFTRLARQNKINPQNVIRDVGLAQGKQSGTRTTDGGNSVRIF